MERPFNYIIQTHVSTLAKPFDNYQQWRNPPRPGNDMIIECVEETYRIYHTDPTIRKDLGLAIDKLCRSHYWWKFGSVSALEIRNERNEIVDKIVERFGSIFTTGMINKIVRKGGKLKIPTLRNLINIQNGMLVTKTTISRMAARGIDIIPIIRSLNDEIKKSKSRKKQFEFNESHLISFILSDQRYGPFSKLYEPKTLKVKENNYDFVNGNDDVRKLMQSMENVPIIKTIKKMCRIAKPSVNFGSDLFEELNKKWYKNKPPTMLNIVGFLIVLDVLGYPSPRIYSKIKTDIVRIIKNAVNSHTKLNNEAFVEIRSELRCLVGLSRKNNVELVDRRVIDIAFKERHDLDILRVMVDPEITSYDPIPDLLTIETSNIYCETDEYISHLLDRGYLQYPSDENSDNTMLYMYSKGLLQPSTYLEKFREHGVDIFSHPLTGDIFDNLLHHIDEDWEDDLITMMAKNKWCFSSKDIDNVILPCVLENILEARLSIETDQDIQRIKRLIRRSARLVVNMNNAENYELYIRILSTLSDYQLYQVSKEMTLPKMKKGEKMDDYLDRNYNCYTFWNNVSKCASWYHILWNCLPLTSDLAEIMLTNTEFLMILSYERRFCEWIRSQSEDILMVSPHYMVREYLMRMKRGEVSPYNLDRFFDEDRIKYFEDYREQYFREAENSFHPSSCTPKEMEKINILKALPAYYIRQEERAIVESFNLLIDGDGEE